MRLKPVFPCVSEYLPHVIQKRAAEAACVHLGPAVLELLVCMQYLPSLLMLPPIENS